MCRWILGFVLLGMSMDSEIFASSVPAPEDFIHLEDSADKETRAFIELQNARTNDALITDERYVGIRTRWLKILQSPDRLIHPNLSKDGYVYNFWTDERNLRGLWRRARYESYLTESPEWEVLLDIDQLNKVEGADWVFSGARRIHTRYGQRAFVSLSAGGRDAAQTREYDYGSRSFVQDGFFVPDSETNLAWLDSNSVLVAHTVGDHQKTKSQYPRRVYLWNRGEALERAELLFEISEEHLSAGFIVDDEEGVVKRIILVDTIDFFTQEYFLLKGREKVRIPIPGSAEIAAVLKGRAIIKLQEDWKGDGFDFKRGSLVSLNLDDLSERPQSVYQSAPDSAVEDVFVTKNYLFIHILRNVSGRILRGEFEAGGGVKLTELDLPLFMSVSAWEAVEGSDDIFLHLEGFVEPARIFRLGVGGSKFLVKEAPKRMDLSQTRVEQFFARSKDGTSVPYFVVGPKDADPRPTLLYGYGGFRVSLTPTYRGGSWVGQELLARGLRYVIANIRGGGEFGPAWHEAALKTNRQKAYDDFIAVAEDLVRRRLTEPSRLAIMGGSNGGLLVSAVAVQRPDLLGAVVSEVPLIDMLRYPLTKKGASWMAEYGDPKDPVEGAALRAYSPLHNIPPSEVKMPPILLTTASNEDRVDPAHARKMAARLLALGHRDTYLYENTVGGHGGSADAEQKAQIDARVCVFLLKSLGVK